MIAPPVPLEKASLAAVRRGSADTPSTTYKRPPATTTTVIPDLIRNPSDGRGYPPHINGHLISPPHPIWPVIQPPSRNPLQTSPRSVLLAASTRPGIRPDLYGSQINQPRRNPRTTGRDARGARAAARVFQRPCVGLEMLDARSARDHVEPVCVTATVTVTVAAPPLSSLASTVRSTEEPAFELISPATVISPELV